MAAKPIKPSEVVVKKAEFLPDYVIEAFNHCIVQHMNRSGTARFTQSKVVKEILQRGPEDLTESQVFTYRWLDVEDIYRKERWRVEYDKPAYNEEGDAWFTFKKPATRSRSDQDSHYKD